MKIINVDSPIDLTFEQKSFTESILCNADQELYDFHSHESNLLQHKTDCLCIIANKIPGCNMLCVALVKPPKTTFKVFLIH
jgi:hypothetical protein